MTYKPQSYNDLSPYLIVDDARGLITFLKDALDGKELRVFEHEGRVVHAEIMVGDSVLMLSDANEQYPAIKSVLHLYVPNVDASFQKALGAGAGEVQAPKKGNDPDKRGTFSDPFGNLWSLGTQVDAG
ncbi:MAG: VOC family protein [Anaerolineales bacterium]|nr:VOC family protein [Anaerolineales bacterium]MCW5855780.1 VOC family protein [Anaerolineales bacterium]